MGMKNQAILIVVALSTLELMPFVGNVAWAQSQRSVDAENYCELFARDYAKRNASGKVLKRAMGGAATGAAAGLILGGRVGRGATLGTIVGAISGGVRKSENRRDLYELAYEDCMDKYGR
jgi:outer membrane lipoprotein SlyB